MFTPRHEATDIDQGGFCNKLVLRKGFGDTCGLLKNDPVHTGVHGHDQEGSQCAPEFCGGTRYDPCTYTPAEIAYIEKLESEENNK